jgi:uncharacterized lipoprotein YddW (UPF0748 family)
MWMTHVGAALMYYTTRLDETVADLAKHHLNTLYPDVWNRGQTLHPSPVVRQAGGLRRNPLAALSLLPHPDVLSGLLYQAHRQHLRLIPWFEYGLMIPPNAAIARQHPDWLTTTQKGAQSLANDPDWGRQAWLNPCHPQVQHFLTDLIVDVVKRYPVDGVQLDDHFGLPIAFGYDPYTVQLYRNEHAGHLPPTDPADPEWIAWRANHITQLMQRIRHAVKAVRPAAIISLSPNTPDFAYGKSLQDWPRWVRLGLLDEVVVQLYRDDLTILRAELMNQALLGVRSSIPISIGLYTGPFLAAKPIQQIQTETTLVRKAGYAGISFFCWETTLWWFKGSPSEQVNQVFLKLFPTISRTHQ